MNDTAFLDSVLDTIKSDPSVLNKYPELTIKICTGSVILKGRWFHYRLYDTFTNKNLAMVSIIKCHTFYEILVFYDSSCIDIIMKR